MKQLLPIFCTSVLLISITSTTDAQSRQWSSSTGKFKVEAELIKVDDGKITLKRADNGKVITVALSKLSKADQEYIASMEGGGSTSKSGSGTKNTAASEAKVTAKAVWSTPKFVDGKQEFDLQLELICKGKAAAEAIEYGMLQVDSVKDSSGNDIEIKKADFRDVTEEYEKVDRQDQFFAKHPKNGVRLTVDLTADASAGKLNDVSGKFKLKTGGEQSKIKLDNVAEMADQEVENAELADLDVKAEIKVDGADLRFELDGQHQSIFKVEAVGSNGKPHPKQNGSGSGGGGSLFQYFFHFEDEVPKNISLVIHVVKNLEELEIPFQATNLKIPKKPKSNF